MTKEQEEETIKYLEVLQKEYLEDAKRIRENGKAVGYGTMEDINKLRALYIGFALEMLKQKDKEIKTLTQTNKSYKGIINKKDRQIDLMARAFKQDDVRTVEEIKQYFERKSVRNELDRRNFTTTCKETSTRYR